MSVFIIAVVFLSCENSDSKFTVGSKEFSKPNIVFILADDMGWNQVNYHNVTQYYTTPNIDHLAQSGIVFTNAYSAAPICSPARASIMTGKYPARLHLTDYLPGNSYPYALLTQAKQSQEGLDLRETTLAEMLRAKGYATGHFGKWHLNKDKNYEPERPGDPASQGFDDVLTTVKPELNSTDTDAHHVDLITDRTIQFIERNKGRPFFAYVSHHVVHRPLIEEKDLINLYKTKPENNNAVNNPIMGAMIERMDRGIGRILKTLEKYNLDDNTIVVFVSDNGGFKYYQDQAPLRGGKAMVFEGGIKVPLAIKWPRVIQPGLVSDEPVITNDFFPTFDEVSGSDVIANVDGVSLVPLLKGDGSLSREALYWHYPHYHRQGYKPSGAVRVGDYKLIEWYEQSILGLDHKYHLYNVKLDVGENNNLAHELPNKVRELKDKLHQWLESVGANHMSPNPNFDQAKQYLPEMEWSEENDYEYLDMHFPNRQ